MLNKRAFTLMELLLVVAILAILAAAAAPTYTEGTKEAFDEAKKSNFLNAFQQTVSGANLMMGMLIATNTKTSSAGSTNKNVMLPANLSLDALNQWKYNINGQDVIRNLNYYVPVKSRLFYTLKGKQYFVSAKIGNNQDIVFYYVDANGDSKWKKGLDNYDGPAATQVDKANQEIRLNERTLDQVWDSIKNEG